MTAHKEVGSLKACCKPHTNLCRGINDEIISKDDAMNRWKTYCQDLLNIATFKHKTFFDSTHTKNIDPGQQETENEPQDMLHTELAIQSMSNNKSPGIDYIPYTNSTAQEGNLVINILHRLIKGIWIEKKVPTDWKTNIIVKIYKIQATNYTVTTTKEYH